MIEKRRISNDGKVERAILVGVCTKDMTFEQSKDYLDELAFLTETAGAKAVRSFIQKLDKPVNSTYIGSGKVEEVVEAIGESEADLVIFDDDLTPSQIRNLDKKLEIKVLDRSSLILHIFSMRAQTAQAKIQVDLAQYQYLLPRLAGMWTHLSRQKGGIGLKGAGEKEIETDRRVIRQRISKLQKALKKIDQQNLTQRKNRDFFVRVALVGYTNVGKSTLMNLISKSRVYAKDELFATLDTTVRKVYFQNIPFLLSDTVGFIRKLPHHLVECFKSTLDEAVESDILIHVVDASHPHIEDHLQVVTQTLQDLNMQNKTVMTVFNKVDCLSDKKAKEFMDSWFVRNHQPSVCISAASKWNLEEFRDILTQLLVEKYKSKAYNGEYRFIDDYEKYIIGGKEIEFDASDIDSDVS